MNDADWVPTTAAERQQARDARARFMRLAKEINDDGADAQLVVGGMLMCACEFTAEATGCSEGEAKTAVIEIIEKLSPTKAH